MKEIDLRYPGLKETFKLSGISVQAQSAYPSRTSIDQRGEQSINRDAETPGKLFIYYLRIKFIVKSFQT